MKTFLTPLEESKLILYITFFFYFLCGLVFVINKNVQPTQLVAATFILVALFGIITTYKLGGKKNGKNNCRKCS